MESNNFNSKNFYLELPIITNFYDISDPKYYFSVPKDWYLILLDIKNSTLAIQQGRYKEVNISGALAITAIANLLGTLEYPFVFGGDGATLLIHNSYVEEAKGILVSLKQKVKENFDLELRIGGISISDCIEKKLTLKIAKMQISKCYYQALFSGDANEYLEDQLKKDQIKFFTASEPKEPNLIGFSCRWQDIESTEDCHIALIIKFKEKENQEKILESILAKIREIYGEVDNWHPVTISKMSTIPLRSKYVITEAKLTNPKVNLFHILKIKIELLLVKFFTKLPFEVGMEINYHDITKIRNMEYASCDFRKMEGALKLILKSSNKQKDLLIEFLENLYSQKKILYGYYTDKKVHITCNAFMDRKQDVHFLDVINGGFTNAAKMLKEKEKLSQVS